ncbi:MAG TPA: arginine--tRNA ligase [Firmicutes bacterium]|nr:arginine--tRNA ligase [Bacillota bacterium]
MDYRQYIAEKIKAEGVSAEEIASLLTVPPDPAMGDYALPCFRFAKVLRKSPVAIAQELAASVAPDGVIAEVSALNGYLNFKVNKAGLARDVLARIAREGEKYGSSDVGAGRVVCIDYSSVNIAKPFHIGHLSTTVIGGALYRIFNFLGFRAVGINHLGDYGTQFGKLIAAYKKWGNREEVERGGIHAINDLYVRFNSEADEQMEAEAREYFRLIESGDKEANELFDWFKSLTLAYVQTIYDRLHITFDSYAGERFYTDKMAPVVEELRQKGLLKESEGAQIVDLEAYGMPPCLILRSDGASLYATRDLAAAIYRHDTYHFYKCLYVVAYQQNLHFRQVFKVLELMGKEWAKDLVHVAYGMVSLEDGAMSTRKGKVVWLEDVISRCVEKARAVLEEKNPALENKEEVAELVGVGAVAFGALCNNKIKDITFSYDRALNFDGETSVYLQYTCARAASVLAKARAEGVTFGAAPDLEPCAAEAELVKQLALFPETVVQAAEKYEPSLISRFLLDAAKLFNKFYLECKIMQAEGDVRAFRLALTEATLTTLKNGLGLLGIGVPEKM